MPQVWGQGVFLARVHRRHRTGGGLRARPSLDVGRRPPATRLVPGNRKARPVNPGGPHRGARRQKLGQEGSSLASSSLNRFRWASLRSLMGMYFQPWT